MDTGSKTSGRLSSLGKNVCVLDEAWDVFLDYLGEHKITTPLTHRQFEEILLVVDKNNRFVNFKQEILHSFQHDSYAWSIVERESRR